MADILVKVTAETATAAAALSKFTNETVHGLNRITGAGALLQRLGAQLAGALSVGALVAFTRQAINTADEMGKLSQRVGITVETLDALRRQGEAANLGFGELQIGLGLFNQRLAHAVQEGGAAAEVFRKFGLSVVDSTGHLRSTEAVLTDVAELFRTLPDGPQKTAAAMELFGRSGRQWIPLLNEGAEGMRRMREQEGGITTDMARRARDFNDRLVALKQTLNEIFITLASHVLPVLNDLLAALQKNLREAETIKDSATGLVGVFKGLATVTLSVGLAFNELGRSIGVFAALGLNNLVDGLNTLLQLFKLWWDSIKALGAALVGLGQTAAAAGQAVVQGLSGNVAAATASARAAAAAANAAIGDNAARLADNLDKASALAAGFLERRWSDTASIVTDTFWDIFFNVSNVTEQIKKLWSDTATAVGKQPLTPAAGAGTAAPLSAAAQKLIADIEAAHAQATQSRLQLLTLEEQRLIEAVNREIINREEAERQITRIREIYARKRAEIERQEADATAAIHLSRVQAAATAVEQSADLGRVEKKRQLTDLLQVETWLLERNIEINRQRVADESLSTEARLEAERQLITLEQQRVQVLLQLRDLQVQESFFGQMQRGLIELSDAWSNLGANLAGGVLDAIRLGVQGVSQAIMGAIAGTRTWGEVFAAVGRQIISSLINIVVQWIVSMTLLRLLKKIFQTEENVQAAQAAAAWAPAAIAASTASYGAAAAVGLAAFLAAVGTGTGIAAGMSTAAGATGFSQGGFTGAGRADEPAGIVHRGEYVIPAAQTRRYFTALELMRTGEFSLTQLIGQGAPRYQTGGLVTDRSSDFNAALAAVQVADSPIAAPVQTAGIAAASRSQPEQKETVKLSVAFIDPTESSVRRWMESTEGQHILVDLIRKRRLDLGIDT